MRRQKLYLPFVVLFLAILACAPIDFFKQQGDISEVTFFTIYGKVWEDKNGDGIQDDDEPPKDGVVVNLRDPDGTLIDSTLTAEDGGYEFRSLKKLNLHYPG